MTTLTATERRSHLLSAVSHGGAYSVKNLTSTVEVNAATVGTVIPFGRIPSNARLLGSSRFYSDVMGAGGAKVDIGLRAVNGNLSSADDPDALSDGHVLSGALSDQLAITLFADYGLPAWDFVASETSDPGGVLEVYGSVTDATTTASDKTMTLELNYVVD